MIKSHLVIKIQNFMNKNLNGFVLLYAKKKKFKEIIITNVKNSKQMNNIGLIKNSFKAL